MASYLGGNVKKMELCQGKSKIIGRETLKLTDEFFELSYVKRYLKDNNLTKENFPTVIV